MMRPVVAGLLAAALAFSQEDQTTFRTTVDVVVAPTTVTDAEGNLVHGLRPDQFRLTDNNKLQQIKVEVAYIPISLVVAIQANASAEPVLSKIKQIAPLLQGMVTGEQGEVAILAFDHRMQLLQDFTSDGARIDQAFEKLKPGSSSNAVTDVVVEAARMLRTRPKERRRVLLLISETRENGSQNNKRTALNQLQFENIITYSVNINRFITTLLRKPEAPRPDPIPYTARPVPAGVPHTPSHAAQVSGNASNSANFVPAFVEIFKSVKDIFVANPVEVYTRFTGGREHSFVSQRDLERAINEIGTELHSQYLITYAPSNKEEGGFHEIVVSVANHPEWQARTRPGYWVAAQPGP
jgi:VWFA-related protein